MARYIEVDLIMGKIAKLIEHNKDKKATTVLFQAGDAVMDCPSADVVPRSEVEKYRQELGEVRFALAEANKDKQGLEKENEVLRATSKMGAYTTRRIEAELNKAKQQVAKQIFEEITKHKVCTNEEDFRVLAELEKKYIGEQ